MDTEEKYEEENRENIEIADIFVEYSRGNLILIALSIIMTPLLLLSTILIGENQFLYNVSSFIYLLFLSLITYKYFIGSLSAINFKETIVLDPLLLMRIGLFLLPIIAILSFIPIENNYLLYITIILWSIYIAGYAYLSFTLFKVFRIYKYFITMLIYIFVIIASLLIPPPYLYLLISIPVIALQLSINNTIDILTGRREFELPSKMYRRSIFGDRIDWLSFNITQLDKMSIGFLSIGIGMAIDLLAQLVLPVIDQTIHKLYINLQLIGPISGLEYFINIREELVSTSGVLSEDLIYFILISLVTLVMISLKYFLLLNGIIRYLVPATFAYESSSVVEEGFMGVLKTYMVFNIYSIIILVYMGLTGLIGVIGLGDPSLLNMVLGEYTLREILNYGSYAIVIVLNIFNGIFCLQIAMVLNSIDKSLEKGTMGSAPGWFYLPSILSFITAFIPIMSILSIEIGLTNNVLELLSSPIFISVIVYTYPLSMLSASFIALSSCRKTNEVLYEEIASYRGE